MTFRAAILIGIAFYWLVPAARAFDEDPIEAAREALKDGRMLRGTMGRPTRYVASTSNLLVKRRSEILIGTGKTRRSQTRPMLLPDAGRASCGRCYCARSHGLCWPRSSQLSSCFWRLLPCELTVANAMRRMLFVRGMRTASRTCHSRCHRPKAIFWPLPNAVTTRVTSIVRSPTCSAINWSKWTVATLFVLLVARPIASIFVSYGHSRNCVPS